MYTFALDGRSAVVSSGKFKPAGGATGDRFGASVATANGRVAVGAPGSPGLGTSGAVALYDQIASNLAELTPAGTVSGSQGGSDDLFGASLAMRGDSLVVGAPGEDSAAADAGAVYLFGSGSRFEQGRLAPPVLEGNTGFGRAVAIDSATIAVGAPGFQSGLGAVFEFGTGNLAQLRVTQAQAGQEALGASVALSDGALLAGAPGSAGSTGDALVRRDPDLIYRGNFE